MHQAKWCASESIIRFISSGNTWMGFSRPTLVVGGRRKLLLTVLHRAEFCAKVQNRHHEKGAITVFCPRHGSQDLDCSYVGKPATVANPPRAHVWRQRELGRADPCCTSYTRCGGVELECSSGKTGGDQSAATKMRCDRVDGWQGLCRRGSCANSSWGGDGTHRAPHGAGRGPA